MPQRTFAEARRLASRADLPDAWTKELEQREQEARQRVREMDAPYRQRLEAQLADLAQQAKANTTAVQRLRDAAAAHRLPADALTARLAELNRSQAAVRQKASDVQQRLAGLAQREEHATDVVDRIAQHTGLGKPNFSF